MDRLEVINKRFVKVVFSAGKSPMDGVSYQDAGVRVRVSRQKGSGFWTFQRQFSVLVTRVNAQIIAG